MQKVNLAEKLSMFAEHWSPKIAGELNGQQVKLVKFLGEFVWHHHDAEDELFLVIRGSFRMDYRSGDGREQAIDLHEGDKVNDSAFKALIRDAVALNKSASRL